MSESDYFTFYPSFLEGIELLPEAEQLKAYRLIARYGVKGELPEGEQTLANAIFNMAKPNIDASKTRRASGKKGGRPQKETDGFNSKKQGKEKEKTNGSENKKPMVIENENQRFENCESKKEIEKEKEVEKEIEIIKANVMVVEEENAHAREDVRLVDKNVDNSVDKCQSLEVGAVEVAADNHPTLSADTEYHGCPTTALDIRKTRKLTESLFSRYRRKAPSDDDVYRVFEHVYVRTERQDGTSIAAYNTDRAALLDYAFEQAAIGGSTSWRYIDGIYKNFNERGIRTVEDAYSYEFRRQQGKTADKLLDKFYE